MKIVFATHNINKIKEVQELMPKQITLLSLKDINCSEEIAETSSTLEGNSIIKANYVYETYQYPCFADDTGLFVSALNGKPGIFTARYAGPEKNAIKNNQKLLKALKGNNNREAFFKTVIAYKTNSIHKTFIGICRGDILQTLEGEQGFGYDPIFKPKGYSQSFASMELNTKNKISHRAKAFQSFIHFLLSEIG